MLNLTALNSIDVPLFAHEAWLLARIAVCCRRAREIGRPVLLRVHTALGDVDPWQLWAAQHTASQPYSLWNDGRLGLCVAGFGALRDYRVAAQGRFAAARAVCAQLLEETVDVGPGPNTPFDVDAPLAFAGFAFSNREPPADSPWGTWGGGQVYVPPVVVYRRQGTPQSLAILNREVHGDAEPTTILRELRRNLSQLSTLTAPVVAPTAAADNDAWGAIDDHMHLHEGHTQWLARVERARQTAHGGSLEKIVLARAADFVAPEGSHFDIPTTLHNLRVAHPRSVCFAIGKADGGCFLGASPEILVQVFGRAVATQAVAGTARRDADVALDAAIGLELLRSAKDRREHEVVADVLRQALSPLCVELTSSNEPRLIRLPQVQHLETPIAGTLRQAGGILELVERLHPTPAVGGWPTAAALHWLSEHESLERGWYAGPVGWLTAGGDGVFAVAIRSVVLAGQDARAYAGAGIVAASDPEGEWNETELKLRTVRDALKRREL